MYQIEGRDIHYVERKGPGPTIIFIHGTPGSWEACGYYLAHDELASRVPLISVDRPGFGSSSEDGIVKRLFDQARMLSLLMLDKRKIREVFLVGHSLGAPLAGELEEMLPIWHSLTIPVTVIQGMKDRLVDLGSIEFQAEFTHLIEKQTKKTAYAFSNRPASYNLSSPSTAGHFILWKKPKWVLKELTLYLSY